MLTLAYTEDFRPTVSAGQRKGSSCTCTKAGTCAKGLAKAHKKALTGNPVSDETIQAVTRDYFINLFNWLGDLPYPLNLLAFLVNCILHTLTFPMLVYIAPNLWSHLQSVLNSSDDPAIKVFNAVRFILSDTYGTVFCTCLPAELWYYASLGFFKVEKQSDAEQAMKHYREGRGRDFKVDVARLIREDVGVKIRIEQGINQQGGQSGQLRDWLRQSDYRNQNWRNTLGNVDLVTYRVINRPPNGQATVDIGIEDPYEWHPDVGRSLPCLHTSMENLKHLGAQDYRQIGHAQVLLTI